MRWQAVGKILAGTATAAVAAVLLGSAHFASAGGAVQAAGGQVAAAAAAEAPAQTVSAVGVAETPAGDAGQMMTLDVGVQQQSQGAELTAAVSAVQAKIAAVRAALQQAGVPAGAIQALGMNINPQYGPIPIPAGRDAAPVPPPATDGKENGGSAGSGGMPAAPMAQGYMVAQSLHVTVATPEALATAIQAAVQAGATSVNTYGKGGPNVAPPDVATLAPAIARATEQAKGVAQASAAAAGVPLGGIRSVSVAEPVGWMTGPGPQMQSWRVQVTVTYTIGS